LPYSITAVCRASGGRNGDAKFNRRTSSSAGQENNEKIMSLNTNIMTRQ